MGFSAWFHDVRHPIFLSLLWSWSSSSVGYHGLPRAKTETSLLPCTALSLPSALPVSLCSSSQGTSSASCWGSVLGFIALCSEVPGLGLWVEQKE